MASIPRKLQSLGAVRDGKHSGTKEDFLAGLHSPVLCAKHCYKCREVVVGRPKA